MSNDDDALGTALWLAAGGAAGYAAARWLVAPALAKQTTTRTSSSSSPPRAPVVARAPAPRALATGPSGSAMPVDPYQSSPTPIGPSGYMQPIDPYADPITNGVVPPVVTAPGIAGSPATTSAATAPSITDRPTTKPPQPSSAATPSVTSAPSGPITRPSQTEVHPASYPSIPAPTVKEPAGAFATSARVRRFDPIFARYRGDIPIEYIRALVERESNGQPSVRAGSAIGLMQIVPVVLADYNKRHGAAYGSDQLTDPATNVAIGCELLRIIVESYRKNHPRIRTLQPNWDNPEYVGLVTLGWNAGFSEAGGLGRVARYLEGIGALDITIDQVSAHAKLAGATKHLSNPAKVAWCKSVVALYLRERALRISSPLV